MRIPLRQRRLVSYLKKLRKDADLTSAQAAEIVGWSASKLSRAEGLKNRLNGDDVYKLCTEAYGADPRTTEALVALARISAQRGWWQLHSSEILGPVIDAIELEADAIRTCSFVIDVIPGYLQTEEYMRAVMRAGSADEDDSIIDERVRVRLARQDRIRERRMERWVVIDELALLRPIGGVRVMAEQLEQLSQLARTSSVRLQVLPLGNEGHASLGCQFDLLSLDDGASAEEGASVDYVYMDSLNGGGYIEDRAEVERYRQAWELMVASALDFPQSQRLVRDRAARMRSSE